jgi:hydroxyacylglutathione hydrolase
MERIGDGVEVLRLRPRGRLQRLTNVYLLEDGEGVTLYESGSVGMADAIRKAAAARGGIKRIVLSHAHADHRGGAAKLTAPILCHEEERPGAEGDGWLEDGFEFSKIRNPVVRALTPRVLRGMDGGPLEVSGTLAEGDIVAGFRVLHLPGHTPGLIGLWRDRDRIAIVSDAVFMFDPFTITARPGRVRLPPPAARPLSDAARRSVRRIAELDPRVVWLGHYGPLTDDARSQLTRAAQAG